MTHFSWRRGNLHAHTTLSDGEHAPEELIAAYEARGYDFLALTDHDLLASVEQLQKHTSLLLIPGTEITANGAHLTASGVCCDILPHADRQAAINDALAQDALVVLNHPHWEAHFEHWPFNELLRLTGYAGIEIFNGITQFGEGNPVATGVWDRLLSSGRRVWGFANDDTHFDGTLANGWNMVRLPAEAPVTWPALREAILGGDFYATTGVTLGDIVWNDGALSVTSENADRIRFFGAHGRLLASFDSPVAAFTPASAEPYVRAEAYGPRGTVAWTQPVFP